jgi:hypothetical protein
MGVLKKKKCKTDTGESCSSSFEPLAVLELVPIVDERNYDYIIRTGFWENIKVEIKGQTNERRNE